MTNDIDGDGRPALAGYDIGADEYLDRLPPDTTILIKPTGIRARCIRNLYVQRNRHWQIR